MAKVTVEMAYTKNMQDYESLRVHFGVIEEEVREGETYEEAVERVYEFVSGRLGDELVRAAQARSQGR